MIARRITAALLPLLLLTVAALAQKPPSHAAPTTQGYSIAGIIVNSETRQPILGASAVIALSADRGSSLSVRTGPDGRFSFSALPAGKYTLTASAPGYRAQGLNQHDNYFTGVAIGPDLDSTNIVFRLQADASIQGHVTDEENEPVRNATIQLFMTTEIDGIRKTIPVQNAGTDDRGYYRVPHLGPGTYYVAVSARPWYAQYSPEPSSITGNAADAASTAHLREETAQLDVAYPLTFYPDGDDSSRATPIALRVGERATADVVMRAVQAVHLRVRTQSGGTASFAAPRISQRVFDGALLPVFASHGFAQPQGIFQYSGLAPGHYVLEIPSGNSRDPRLRKGWYRDIDLAGDMEIFAGDSPSMANITGLVTYEGAAPPRHKMYLQLRSHGSSDTWTGEVSDKGLFGVSDNELQPGTYQVDLYGASNWYITHISGQGVKVEGLQVTLAAGAAAKLICTASYVASDVNGTVLRDDKPVAGAMVLLVPDDAAHQGPRFRRDQSDSDGTFTLQQVLPGSYTVVAIENGWDLDWGTPDVLKPYLANGEKITVTAGSNSKVKIKVQ